MPGVYTVTAKSGKTYDRGFPRLFPDDPTHLLISAPGADGGMARVDVMPDDSTPDRVYIVVGLDGGAYTVEYLGERTRKGWALEHFGASGAALPQGLGGKDLDRLGRAALGPDFGMSLDAGYPLLRRLAREERVHEATLDALTIFFDQEGRPLARDDRHVFGVTAHLARSSADLDVEIYAFLTSREGSSHSARYVALRDDAGTWSFDLVSESARHPNGVELMEISEDATPAGDVWRRVSGTLLESLPLHLRARERELGAFERECLSIRARELVAERALTRGNVFDLAAYRENKERAQEAASDELERQRTDGERVF